jgi:transketolase
MRKHFSTYLEKISGDNQNILFLTGDLGYNALENLAAVMGDRFINAGVAEQNMVGMAAGLASQGYQIICYSIAPFVVYRCLEQIRNDVCFHNLPVYIVGNGGGYGYGIMGSSHHTIEDIACLSGLPNMTCYVPAFVEDMNACMDRMFAGRGPAYLRLGLGKEVPNNMLLTEYGAAPSKSGAADVTVIAQSPVANNVFAALQNGGRDNIDVFVINKMPMRDLPKEITQSIGHSRKVLVVEEHIAIGGLGSAVSLGLNSQGIALEKFISLHAQGYPGGLYGSQTYHQQESGLDEASIANTINSFF